MEGPPNFVGLDWSKPIVKSRRKLPHWTQEGATYFITFRLADSLPREKLVALEAFRAEWERAHPEPRDEEVWRLLSRETLRRVEDWLDAGSGECWLRNEACASFVTQAMRHFDGERYFLSSYCVMPNHVHVTVRPFAGFDLSGVLKSWKGFTARQINQHLGRTGTVWEPESYDTLVRDVAHLWKVVRYVGNNPKRGEIPEGRWVRWVHPSWERAGFGFGGEGRG